MKKYLSLMTLIFVTFLMLSSTKAQDTTTLVLRPGTDGKDAGISNYYSYIDRNFGNHQHILAIAGTSGGKTNTWRSLMQFDFSEIPDESEIINARLSFYFDDDYPYFDHREEYNFYIQRITSDWGESTVTWNTQPTFTTTNQVYVPKQGTKSNFPNIDITNLVVDILQGGEPNYGFRIALAVEQTYNAVVFGSFDHLNKNLRPTLEITYIPPENSGDCCIWTRNGDDTYYNSGNVGIGLENPTNALDVNGAIKAKEFLATPYGWPDYVFREDYRLMKFEDLESYIKLNGHLPGVPSIREVNDKGIGLVETNKILLEKIEELTLYLLQLKKEIDLVKGAK